MKHHPLRVKAFNLKYLMELHGTKDGGGGGSLATNLNC
jgi:hypothetical protein